MRDRNQTILSYNGAIMAILEKADHAMTLYRNGGAAIAETLHAHGVDAIFGIPGTHNLEIYRHLVRLGIQTVTSRHEQGAGYAADGYT